jgi:hypothetical protein
MLNGFAEVDVLDRATTQEHATCERPHRFTTGVEDVRINRARVLRDWAWSK